MLKRLLALAISSTLCLGLCLGLCACSAQGAEQSASTEASTGASADPSAESAAPEAPASDEAQDTADGSSRILIAYFSYPENADLPADVDVSSSASIQDWDGEIMGNVAVLASMIAQDTGGTLSPILTLEKYPDTYDATIELAQAEQRENARPALSSTVPDLSAYDTVFLGYPNWWGDLPMPVYTFLDETDLSGKTIIPFVSHGGSGFSDTIRSIQEAEPDATVVEDGLSVGAGSVSGAQEQVDEWISSLGLAQG